MCNEVVRTSSRLRSHKCNNSGFIDTGSHRSQASLVCVPCGHALKAGLNTARKSLK